MHVRIPPLPVLPARLSFKKCTLYALIEWEDAEFARKEAWFTFAVSRTEDLIELPLTKDEAEMS